MRAGNLKLWSGHKANSSDLADLLAVCLDEASRGEDLEQVLAGHPDQAETLRPLLLTASSMRESMATPIREDRRLAARRRVLQAGRRPLPMPVTNPVRTLEIYRTPNVLLRPLWSAFAPAFVAALFFVIAFIPMMSLTSVSALPGDWNYGFKRATERVRLALALDPSERLNLQLAFHYRRLGEIERLAADGRLTDPSLVQAFSDETSALVQTVSQNPQIGPSEALKVAFQTQAQVQALSDKVAPLASGPVKSVVNDAVQQSEQVQIKASEVAQSKQDAVAARTPSTQGTVAATATGTPKSGVDDASTATATPAATATATATATPSGTALVPPAQPPLSVPAAPPRLTNPAPAPIAAQPARPNVPQAALPLVPPAQPGNQQRTFTKPLVPGQNALTYIGPELPVPQALSSITGAYDVVYYTQPKENGSAVFSYVPGQSDAPGMLEPGSQVTISIKPGVPATLIYAILPPADPVISRNRGMTANEYHLVSHWLVEGTEDEVFAILSDPLSLPRWWGSVYLTATAVSPSGDAAPDAAFIAVRARGWLPYSLRLTFHETERHPPSGYSLAVSGDLNGSGIWTFTQTGGSVAITFDWKVRADKAVVRVFSPLLKPLFASNHHWTMRRGEESLRLELLRRRAQTDWERAQIPEPPRPFGARGPAFAALGGIALIAALGAMVRSGLTRRGS